MALRDRMGVCIPNYHSIPASDYDRIARAFAWTRIDGAWNSCDRGDGTYRHGLLSSWCEAMAARGVSTLVILNYGNSFYPQLGLTSAYQPPVTAPQLGAWERWVRRLVADLDGLPVAWEVWNEPYGAGWWGGRANPEEYAALCTFTRDVLRDCAPGATLVSGGGLATYPHGLAVFDPNLGGGSGGERPSVVTDTASNAFGTDYVERYLAAGGHVGFDAVSLHPYRDYWPPEDITEVDWLRDRAHKPIWLTELGWTLGWRMTAAYNHRQTTWHNTSPDDTNYTPEDQARYLTRSFLVASAQGVEKLFWYNWCDYGGMDSSWSRDPLVDNTRFPRKWGRRHWGTWTYGRNRLETNYGVCEEHVNSDYEDWRVSRVSVSGQGSGYPDVTVTISGGGGSGATAEAIVAAGQVIELVLTAPGSGYDTAPSVTITDSTGAGRGAKFQAIINHTLDPTKGVLGFHCYSHGMGYAWPKMVSSGPTMAGFVQATGTVSTDQMTAGVIQAGTITAAGAGYLAPPGVWAEGGYGGWSGTRMAGPFTATVAAGVVTGVALDGGGSIGQYTPTPTVTFSGGGGSGAKAIPIVVGGMIVAYHVTDPGSGYTSAPTVTIAPGMQVSSASGNPLISTGGYGAAATAVLGTDGDADKVVAVTVGSRGSGYMALPVFRFDGGNPSRSAWAVATVIQGVDGNYPVEEGDYGIDEIFLLDGGAGYGSTPTAVLVPQPAFAPVVFKTTIDASGAVDSLTVLNGAAYPNGNYSYGAPPRLEFVGGPGSTKGDVVLRAGKVIGVLLTQTGGGYPRNAQPALSIIEAGGGTGASLAPVMARSPLPGQAKPAYAAAVTLMERLGDFEFVRETGTFAPISVPAYVPFEAFCHAQLWRAADGREAYVVWCNEAAVPEAPTWTVPANASHAIDHLGGDVALGATITLSPNPVIVFMEP